MVKDNGYGQFCPVSRASEILAERWTPLVVRELLCGSVRFNDIQRGVPRMSSALLSRRLKELEHSGILEHRVAAKGRGGEYHLTGAGKALRPILDGMGLWAQHWVRHDLTLDKNLDPDLLMWDIRRRVLASHPQIDKRFIVLFQFSGVPVNRRRFWLVFDRNEIDLCMKDPGHEVDLSVFAHVRMLIQIWLGHISIAEASRDQKITFDGKSRDIKAFASWFVLSKTAKFAQNPPG